MSATAETTLTRATPAHQQAVRPSFAGAVRGELLKMSRQRATWVMLGMSVLLFAVFTLALTSASQVRTQLHSHPLAWFYNQLDILLALFDTGSGIVLLIVSARLIGMEYSGGTIRVLLARGTGRLQLLAAKLVALALLGIVLLAGFLVLASGFIALLVNAWEGSLQPLQALPADAWRFAELQLLVAVISIAVCVLLGSAAAVVGRSLAFGLSGALAFFPCDNFGTIVLGLLTRVTGKQFWSDFSAYLLGPNLNQLPGTLETNRNFHGAFATPLVKVDTSHALLVIGAYAAVFLFASVVLTWRRDVLE